MKTILLIISLVCLNSKPILAGTLRGAWEMVNNSEKTNERVIMIGTLNYVTISVFEKNNYIRTYGGRYTIDNYGLKVHFEFDDKHPENVGNEIVYKFIRQNEDNFSIENQLKTSWKRIDKTGNLDGLWRITSRVNEAGVMTEMQKGDRKTLKICSAGRFQWFAINPAEKGFYGTGGGTYTLTDGKYTETIEFFSRDNSRVGTSLGFEATINENKWRHSGKSSVGKPVDEIWERE